MHARDHRFEITSDGFSLLEVLITLSVTSMMLIQISSFFVQLNNIAEVNRKISQSNEATALSSFLDRKIGNANLLPIFEYGFQEPKFFVGTNSSVQFVSEARRGVDVIGLFDTSIIWKPEEKKLLELRKMRRQDVVGNEVQQLIEISSNVVDFNIKYGDPSGPNSKLAWSDDWSFARNLPYAVKIRGVINRGSDQMEFELTIPMQNKRAYTELVKNDE